jgi:hypothetical protein
LERVDLEFEDFHELVVGCSQAFQTAEGSMTAEGMTAEGMTAEESMTAEAMAQRIVELLAVRVSLKHFHPF